MGSVPRFYVYLLVRPDGRAFYVGKGQGSRVFEHDREAQGGHKCHKCNVIRKIWKQGKQYQRYIIFTTDDEQEALAYEREQIAFYGRKNLCNLTDGGEGCSGRALSDKTKAKISAAHKGKKWSLGLKRTAETRARMSVALRGRKMTDEQVKRMSDRMKGKPSPMTPEAREKLRERMKGNTYGVGKPSRKGQAVPEEQRRKISETLKAKAPWKGKKHKPESIQKMREVQAGRVVGEEQRANLRAAWERRRLELPARYEVMAPNGEQLQTNNLVGFAREQGVSYNTLLRARQTGRVVKGWRVIRRE